MNGSTERDVEISYTQQKLARRKARKSPRCRGARPLASELAFKGQLEERRFMDVEEFTSCVN